MMAPHPLAAALAAASLLTLSLWPGLESAVAQTLPSGLNVVQGQARVATAGSAMTVTNSPGAILNWNSFSIGTQSAVRFEQVNASSQVLNRVVGNDPSSILGRLSSNGKVWLLNPNGVLFGQNARVDVAGLVTSTLNLADHDWSAGRYAFTRINGSAGIVNQGELRSSLGGYVMLVGSSVRNEGLIEAPGGQIVLAAGQSVELLDTGSPHLSVKVTAPQGSALNLGTLAAAGGRIDIHAAVVNQQGLIRASSLDVGAGGEIVLRASEELTLGAESRTLADGGSSGGTVTVDSGIGTNMIHGQVSATGSTGQGGQVRLLGRHVGLAGAALVDVSGAGGGGQVLVGGGQQGLDASVPNSEAVFFGPNASITADATASGTGGRIILWSDKSTRAYGSLSARGGPVAGNGGFIETSGHWLDARPAKIDTAAPYGVAGQWLIDPYDVLISDFLSDGDMAFPSSFNIQPGSYFTANGDSAGILTSDINTALQAGTLVTISTGAATGTQAGNVTFRNAHIRQASSGGTSQLNVAASGNIVIDNSELGIIGGTESSANGTRLNMNLQAGLSGEGAVSISNNSTLQTNGGRLDISGTTGTALAAVSIRSSTLDAGSGRLNVVGRHHGSEGATTGVRIDGASLYGDSILLEGSAVASNPGSTGVDLMGSYVSSSRSMTVTGIGAGFGVRLTGGNHLVLSNPTSDSAASLSVHGTNTAASSGYGVYINVGSDVQAVGSYNGATVSITGETAVQNGGNAAGIYAVGSVGMGTPILSSGALELRSGHDIQLVNFGLQSDSTLSLAAPAIVVSNPPGPSGPSDVALPVQSSADKFVVSADHLSLGPDTRFESAAVGNAAMVLRGFSTPGMQTVTNAAGSTALSAPNGRWLVYATNPVDPASSGLGDLNYDFKQYGAVVDGTVLGPAGTNGLMFSMPQVAALRADVATRNYDGTRNVSASNFRVQGVPGDVATGQSLGAPPAYLSADVGVDKPVTVGAWNVVGFQDANERPVYGYILRNEVTGTVFPKPLQWSVRADDKVYDATTRATVALIAPPAGLIGSETVGVNIVASFDDKRVGVGKPISFNAQMVDGTNGGKASNYSAPQEYPAVVASITPASLTVSGLVAANKVYDGRDATTVSGTAIVSPLGTDSVSAFASGQFFFSSRRVGNNTPVNLDGYVSLTGADAANYTAINPVLAASITPAPLVLSGLVALNKVYDSSVAASLSGSPQYSAVRGDQVTVVSGTARFSDKNAGIGKPVSLNGYSLSGAEAVNYTLVLPTGLSADITPAALRIGGIGAVDKVYDTTTAATLRGSAAVQPLAGDSVSVTGSGIARFADKNVGNTKAVSVSGFTLAGADAGNYLAVQPALAATITPASLTVSGLAAASKVYDTSTLTSVTGTAVVSPLGSDSVSASVPRSAFFDTRVVGNDKPVTLYGGVELSGADAQNYTAVAPVLAANITPAPLVLSGLVATNKVYDSTVAALLSGRLRYSPLGDDSVDVLSGTARFSDKNAGIGKQVSLNGYSLNGADAVNYTLVLPTGLSADITPARLAANGVTVNNKVYDANTAATFSHGASLGAFAGDAVTVNAGEAQFVDKNVGTNKAVRVTGLVLAGADAANYVLDPVGNLSADITPATLRIGGIGAVDKVYDTTTMATLRGSAAVQALAGDSVSVTVTGSAIASFADKNVGSAKAVSVSGFTLAGADAGNYLAVQPALAASITPASLTVSGLAAASKVYDTSTLTSVTGTAVVSPLGTDSVSAFVVGPAFFDTRVVGNNKPVTLEGHVGLTGPDAPNYIVIAPVLAANITPAPLVLSGLVTLNKVYDSTVAASLVGGLEYSPLGGDGVNVVSGTARFADKNAGIGKPVSLNGYALSGPDAINYTLVLPTGLSADITPVRLSANGVTVNNKVYDANTSATFSHGASLGAFAGDAVTVNAGEAQFVDKNVGSNKAVQVTGLVLSGADAANYVLAPVGNLSANITPAALLIGGVGAVDKVYDTTTAATLSGRAAVQALAGDSVSLTGSGIARFADKNVGSAKAVSVSGFTLAGADAGNYLAVQPLLAASITPASLTVSGLTATSKVYDGSTLTALTGTAIVSPLGADSVSAIAQGSAIFDSRVVGNDKPVTLSGGVSLSGADAQNYTAVAPFLAANITSAPLVLSGLVALNKVYDSSVAALLSGSPQYSAVQGDQVTVVSGTVRFSDKNAGVGKPVALNGYALSGADAVNYTLVVPTGLSADITPARLAVNGLAVNNKVYDANTAATFSHGASLGAFAGDAVTVNAGEAQFVDKNVGANKAVRVTGLVLAGADAANYVLDPVGNLSANITPAALQYRANPASKASGDALPSLEGTVTGFVGGETPQTATTGALVFTSTAGVQSPAGSYAVQGGGLAASNYTFEQAQGNVSALTVTGANPTATLNQSVVVALTIALATPTVKINSATSGLIDFMQAPAAGNPAAALSPSDLGSSPSFAGVRLSAMSQDQLTSMLAERDRYKKTLFADAIFQLEQDASLADLPPCKSREDVEQGKCLLTDELKREIRKALETQAPQLSAAPLSTDPATSVAVATTQTTQTTQTTLTTQPSPAMPATPNIPTVAVVASPALPSLSVNLAQKRKIKSAALPQIERKVAVVIGVDQYADQRIPPLANAVNDARSVGSLFESALGYETVVLANATKQSVVSAMNKLALELGPRDSVIVYYAGHGELVEATGLGYWQLADSDAALPQTWLSNADISRMVAQIGASQVALISDSCYSGSLVSNDQVRAMPGGLDPKTLLSQKSVVVMSSGGNEPVFDQGRDNHSPFAWNLMDQLKQVNKWQPGGNVFARVRFAVARELPQRPKYGSSSAAGHQPGGDYLFEQRQLEASQ